MSLASIVIHLMSKCTTDCLCMFDPIKPWNVTLQCCSCTVLHTASTLLQAILKTCGTTKLLASVPALIDAADAVGLTPCRAKYSRASFLFPEQQVRHAMSMHQRGCSLPAHLEAVRSIVVLC